MTQDSAVDVLTAPAPHVLLHGLCLQIDLSDVGMRALVDEAKSAALAGWSGKQVIHPKQVRHACATPVMHDMERTPLLASC